MAKNIGSYYANNLEDLLVDWKPRLHTAPHGPIRTYDLPKTTTSFARLAGRLFEWNFVYELQPPQHSWIWKFYRGYEGGGDAHMKECRTKAEQFTEAKD